VKKNEKLLVIGALGIGAYLLFKNQSAPVATDPGGVLAEQYENDVETPSPVIHTSDAATTAARSALAKEDLGLLKRFDPSRYTVYQKMTDQEIIDSWEYVWSYMLKGFKLYRLPGKTGNYTDGGYNTKLFDAIAAIKSKYGIF
jgi:hypothetical protein